MNSNFTLPVFSEHSKRSGRFSHIPNPDLFAILPLNDEDLYEPDDAVIQHVMSFVAAYNVVSSEQLGPVEEYRN